ncbi:MAG: hypothetical protein ACI8W3_002694 [Myxococcota bacterium]|jgi:hypothetical protein
MTDCSVRGGGSPVGVERAVPVELALQQTAQLDPIGAIVPSIHVEDDERLRLTSMARYIAGLVISRDTPGCWEAELCLASCLT